VPVHSGIPFGPWHLPPHLYGPEFSGGYLALSRVDPVGELEAARRTNTRILINLTNSSVKFTDDKGHFSLEKWKHRVDRFKHIDFGPYVADGTLIGHFILDEPQDKSNWGGGTVSQADIDAMAKYSKELWPTMPVVIRAWASYLKGYNYQYLDAAWAQYLERFGPVDAFIKQHVTDAREVGLALVAGLNLVAGGGKNGIKGYHNDRFAMTASQVTTWGNALLAEPYFCAFLSWQYNEAYFARADIQSALAELNKKAGSLPKKSCRK
jgi:hypothetical protein